MAKKAGKGPRRKLSGETLPRTHPKIMKGTKAGGLTITSPLKTVAH